jgi:hypothetical protein
MTGMMGELWLYDSSICTGFGDRLGIIIALSALARLHDNSTVYMEWCTDTQRVSLGNPLHMKFIPKWTGWNYPMETVRAHITLPGNVRFFLTDQQPALQFKLVSDGSGAPVYHGIPQTSTLYWKSLRMSDMKLGEDQYIQAYKSAGNEVGSLAKHVSDYVLVHFRGPDDNTWRPDDSVFRMQNFCTREVVRAVHSARIFMRVISNNYTNTLQWLEGLPSIEIVHLGDALTDLQLVLSAAAIIQHGLHGWSAYSSIPAMAKSIPLINTYSGYEHRYTVFQQYGNLPAEFHKCNQIELFLSRTKTRLEAKKPPLQ